MPDQAPVHQAREFAAAFREFLEWIHSPAAGAGDGNEVSALVRDFLGPDGAHHSVVTRELPRFEHVNLQTAINTWSARAGRTVEVRGIAMPGPYSSDHSVRDAREMAEKLGIAFDIVPITPGYDEMLRVLAPVFRDAEPDVTEENIQSRLRGLTLMALSNKFNALVLTTGNKSELAVGYCTLPKLVWLASCELPAPHGVSPWCGSSTTTMVPILTRL